MNSTLPETWVQSGKALPVLKAGSIEIQRKEWIVACQGRTGPLRPCPFFYLVTSENDIVQESSVKIFLFCII